MSRRCLFALLPLGMLTSLALGRPQSGLWSLQPVGFPRVPVLKSAASQPVANPLDAFIRARLQKSGLSPAPEADKRTLIRRVSFDLTGLPPTPKEINDFLADTRPDAYEKLVDRLLASPRYGERWARHWLDLARFGESDGYEYDSLREHAWRYRDWVVEALNRDLPYDQFVREQLAGDVLGSPAATGFLVAGPLDRAGKSAAGLQVRLRAREEELEDMIGVVGQTFLGLTIHCARCHDHKFDPIPQRDYYRIKAALAGVQAGNRSTLTAAQTERRNQRRSTLREQLARAETQLRRIEEPTRRQLLAAERPTVPISPQPFLQLSFEGRYETSGARTTAGRLVLDGKQGTFQSGPLSRDLREKTLEAWVRLADRNQQGGSVLTLETEGGEQFDGLVFGERQRGKWMAGSEFFHRTRDLDAPEESAGPDELVQMVGVYHADGRIQLFRNGKPYAAAYQPESAARLYPAGKSHLLIGPRHTGAQQFFKGTIEEVRVYDRALTESEIAESFRLAPFNLTPEALEAALSPELRVQRRTLHAERERLGAELAALEKPEQGYAVLSERPGPTYVLPRGDVSAQGERVTPGGLSAITACSPELALADDAPESQRRLALARWLTAPQSPLLARVLVNRVWQQHFGRGLVGTASDFGNNGEQPTHPELLDWLATVFSGPGEWSLKRLHRLMVTSQTYRQASTANPKAQKLDPDNRLLWRMAPRRLEAEVIRDALLAVSGKLNPAIGGPSFRPFVVSKFGSDFYTLVDKDTPEFNRRTLYRMTVQGARSPLLETLDCPDPSTKTPKRTVTTTPTQALALMNDRFVLRQSRALAERVQREAGDTPERQIVQAYTLAFGRPPTPTESRRALVHLKNHPLDSLCWALFNASEFLYAK